MPLVVDVDHARLLVEVGLECRRLSQGLGATVDELPSDVLSIQSAPSEVELQYHFAAVDCYLRTIQSEHINRT